MTVITNVYQQGPLAYLSLQCVTNKGPLHDLYCELLPTRAPCMTFSENYYEQGPLHDFYLKLLNMLPGPTA